MYSFVQPECTFILLDPALPDTEGTGQHGGGETALSANAAFKILLSMVPCMVPFIFAFHCCSSQLEAGLPARCAMSQAVCSNIC